MTKVGVGKVGGERLTGVEENLRERGKPLVGF